MSFNKLLGFTLIAAPLAAILSMPETNLGPIGILAAAIVAAGMIIAGIEGLDNDRLP